MKASNNLIYTVSKFYGKYKIIVKIGLNDECNNGHQDFAITADIYEKSKNNRWLEHSGGCLHDEILEHFPQFKIFVDLHLSDFSGAPMYAIENGYYWLKNDKKIAMNYLRISESEYQELKDYAKGTGTFRDKLMELHIPLRWKKEAERAIAELEKLTGQTFINDSKRSHLD